MSDDKKDLDVSNTVIVKAQERGLDLETAKALAEDLAEEEAKSIFGQTYYWLRANWNKILLWVGTVGGVGGLIVLEYLYQWSDKIK